MKTVISMGALYRITNAEFKKQLKSIASNNGYWLDDDRCIATGIIDLDRMDCEEARDLLNEVE